MAKQVKTSESKQRVEQLYQLFLMKHQEALVKLEIIKEVVKGEQVKV